LGKFHRINQYIKSETVRVIGQDSAQLGVMTLKEALEKAKVLGVDVVEVAEKANPPVVKLIEFSKFKYQENKKDRAGAASAQETKEIILHPFMAENDIAIRVKQAEKFLKSGDRVKLVVKFQGREITKKEFGEKVMNQALSGISEISTVVEQPKYMGKLLIAQVKPKK